MSNSDPDAETGITLVDGPVENLDVPSTPQQDVKLRQVKRWLSGTLSQKNLMALTGLFLCFFLIIHLRDLWYEVQFGHLPVDKDGQEYNRTLF